MNRKFTYHSLLFLHSFLEGAALMGVELLAARLIAPAYGTAIYVWAAVISVTLAALAIGYAGGGLFADKVRLNSFFGIVVLSAILTAALPFTGKLISELTIHIPFTIGLLLTCLAVLLPPVTLFAMVSPLTIHLVSEGNNVSGVPGKVYGISTLGGVLSALLTGFYLGPFVGLKITCYIFSGLLLLVPLLYGVRLMLRKKSPS